jgi:hypothetical protein
MAFVSELTPTGNLRPNHSRTAANSGTKNIKSHPTLFLEISYFR